MKRLLPSLVLLVTALGMAQGTALAATITFTGMSTATADVFMGGETFIHPGVFEMTCAGHRILLHRTDLRSSTPSTPIGTSANTTIALRPASIWWSDCTFTTLLRGTPGRGTVVAAVDWTLTAHTDRTGTLTIPDRAWRATVTSGAFSGCVITAGVGVAQGIIVGWAQSFHTLQVTGQLDYTTNNRTCAGIRTGTGTLTESLNVPTITVVNG